MITITLNKNDIKDLKNGKEIQMLAYSEEIDDDCEDVRIRITAIPSKKEESWNGKRWETKNVNHIGCLLCILWDIHDHKAQLYDCCI